MATPSTTGAEPDLHDDERARVPLVDGTSAAIVILAGVLPFTTFLAENATILVHTGLIIVDAVVWNVLWFVAFLGVRLLARARPPRAVAAAFVGFALAFWSFNRWLPHEPSSPAMRWFVLGLWCAVAIAAVVLAYRLARSSHASTFLILFLGIWTVASLGNFAITRTEANGGTAPTVTDDTFGPFGSERPNVYWFVFDEHARADQLQLLTGVEDLSFDRALADRGFSVSTSSKSAYLHTQLSLASTLAMDYPFVPGNDYRADFLSTNPIIMGDNPVVATFEANGYRYVYAPDGSVEWVACPPSQRGDRVCVPSKGSSPLSIGPNLVLTRRTPIGALPITQRYNDLESVMAGVDEVDDGEQPLFVYAHILAPHFPHRYLPDCSLRDHFVEGYELAGAERIQNYATDIECLDKEFVGVVDRLVADDPDAVIIVQSDHGSRFSFDWDMPMERWTATNFTERFAAVNAIRLPEACRGDSIEGEPLVNTFRLVFACLSGSEPDLLPARTFFSEFHKISTLAEVPAEAFERP